MEELNEGLDLLEAIKTLNEADNEVEFEGDALGFVDELRQELDEACNEAKADRVVDAYDDIADYLEYVKEAAQHIKEIKNMTAREVKAELRQFDFGGVDPEPEDVVERLIKRALDDRKAELSKNEAVEEINDNIKKYNDALIQIKNDPTKSIRLTYHGGRSYADITYDADEKIYYATDSDSGEMEPLDQDTMNDWMNFDSIEIR